MLLLTREAAYDVSGQLQSRHQLQQPVTHTPELSHCVLTVHAQQHCITACLNGDVQRAEHTRVTQHLQKRRQGRQQRTLHVRCGLRKRPLRNPQNTDAADTCCLCL